MGDRPQWQITVTVPADLPQEMLDSLSGLIAHTVHDVWEPSRRDGWDADVSGRRLARAVPGTPAATTQDHRVAYDNDGGPWDEIETGVFKYRSDDGDGDELSLAQLDECYGLAALSPAPGNEPDPMVPIGPRLAAKMLGARTDLLVGVAHEFDGGRIVGFDNPDLWASRCSCGWTRMSGNRATMFGSEYFARGVWQLHAERAASVAQEGADRG